jgi:acetyl-CoA carboxylase biotin carboxyl carrier protein
MAQLEIESEVQGNVWKVLVSEGDSVSAGQVLLIIESMKMEIPVEAPAAGRVAAMKVAEEQAVEEDELLAVVETD